MVPFGLTESQFSDRYRRMLDKQSDLAIETISRILALPVPASVLRASVELFMGEYGEPPTGWIYFRGENNKIDHEDPSVFPGRAMNIALPLAALGDFDDRYFDIELFQGSDLAANVLKAWFAECWWKAGGWSYHVPTVLHVHDDYGDGTVIDLSRSRG